MQAVSGGRERDDKDPSPVSLKRLRRLNALSVMLVFAAGTMALINGDPGSRISVVGLLILYLIASMRASAAEEALRHERNVIRAQRELITAMNTYNDTLQKRCIEIVNQHLRLQHVGWGKMENGKWTTLERGESPSFGAEPLYRLPNASAWR